MAHDINGKFHLATNFGYYPNHNIMDAFCCFTVKDKTQYNVRASRELRPDIDIIKVGPFSYEMVAQLKKVRFALGENEYGISFDITCEGVSPPHEEDPEQRHITRGRIQLSPLPQKQQDI